jgi:hypothetical protein
MPSDPTVEAFRAERIEHHTKKINDPNVSEEKKLNYRAARDAWRDKKLPLTGGIYKWAYFQHGKMCEYKELNLGAGPYLREVSITAIMVLSLFTK